MKSRTKVLLFWFDCYLNISIFNVSLIIKLFVMSKKWWIAFLLLWVIIGCAISIFYYLSSLNCVPGYIRVYNWENGLYNCEKMCPTWTTYECKVVFFGCSCVEHEK